MTPHGFSPFFKIKVSQEHSVLVFSQLIILESCHLLKRFKAGWFQVPSATGD
jgi:hypothetical protein